MSASRTRACAVALFLVHALGSGQAAAAESLDYRVSYDGVLTAFREIGIGQARLDVEQTSATVDGQPVVRARLTASSAEYPIVERFYPYRYQFTSYHLRGETRTLAYERRKQTTRLRHDLLVADRRAGTVRRFNVDANGAGHDVGDEPGELLKLLRRAGLPDYRAQLVPHPGVLAAPRGALDRLALLQQVRTLPMEPDTLHELEVTDGKEIIRYRARVALREVIDTGSGPREAWKVRIDGFESGDPVDFSTARESPVAGRERGDERLRHPPIYLWIDAGPRRTPLRLVSHHAVGTFTVVLDRERSFQNAALASPMDAPLER